MKLITTAFIITALNLNCFAQADPKTGYTNVEFIISKLPDVKKISDELEKQKKQYDIAYQQKSKEFQDKYAAYQKNGASLPDFIKKDKEKELQTLQTSIQELQQNAEKDLADKQAKMVQPLYVKVYQAIQTVAEENGYKFIFNTGDSNQMRHILVAPSDGDVSELVLKKLGATAKEEKTKESKDVAVKSETPTSKEEKPSKTTATTKKPVVKAAPSKKKK